LIEASPTSMAQAKIAVVTKMYLQPLHSCPDVLHSNYRKF